MSIYTHFYGKVYILDNRQQTSVCEGDGKMTVSNINFVLGKIEKGVEQATIEQIKKIEGVCEAYLVFGKYDFLVRVYARTQAEFKKALQEINTLENIHEITPVIGGGGE